MHVVITGASSGIGEALAREYARAGASLTLVARRRGLLEQLAGSVHARTHIVAADLADVERATDWLAGAEAALGPIDVLVNNAGVQIVAQTATIPVEQWEMELRVDLGSPLRLMHAVLPSMLARRQGTIVNVTSAAAFNHMAGMAHYCAAKAGLSAASEALRAELRGTGVHVLTVYPGPVHTALAERGDAAYQPSALKSILPYGTVDVLARRVRRAVERRRASVVYPRFYALARWFPELSRLFTDRSTPPVRALPPPAAESDPPRGTGTSNP